MVGIKVSYNFACVSQLRVENNKTFSFFVHRHSMRLRHFGSLQINEYMQLGYRLNVFVIFIYSLHASVNSFVRKDSLHLLMSQRIPFIPLVVMVHNRYRINIGTLVYTIYNLHNKQHNKIHFTLSYLTS